MKVRTLPGVIATLLACSMLSGCADRDRFDPADPSVPPIGGGPAPSESSSRPLRFVFIASSVGEEFHAPVKKGMADAARMLGVEAAFIGTPGVDAEAQAAMIAKAAEEGCDGIAVQIIDREAFDDAIAAAVARGVPVVAFNTDDATPNARLSAVNQNLYEAGRACGRAALAYLAPGAEVLVTLHDDGVSALEDRYRGITEELAARGVAWTRVITGIEPAGAGRAVSAALRAHPSVHFVICTGQADLEPAGLAIEREHGGQGYAAAGFDLSAEILRLLEAGIIKFTIDQQPYAQGFYPVVQLTLLRRYGIRPSDIDAGAFVITPDMAAAVRALKSRSYR